MSDFATSPSGLSLEFVRKLAKRTLKRLRAGDGELLESLQRVLPHLSGVGIEAIADQVKLADIHQALARSHGFANWAAFKHHLESLQPIDAAAAQFLKALRDDDFSEARRLSELHPALADHNIWCAAALGNASAVKAMLDEQPELATANPPGDTRTALYYLTLSRFHTLGSKQAKGLENCAKLLLDAGADANTHILWDSTDPQSKLPVLYCACNVNNVPVVRLLLEHGAEPNDGESIYHAAEHNHRECLELLVEHGGDISSRHPHWDNTPLYFLAGYKEFHPSCKTSELGMRWLLEHGADPNIVSITVPAVISHVTGSKHAERLETPLHRIAAYGRSAEVAQLLIEHGAKVDAPRADGRTPYVMALRSGNRAVAELLTTLGADTTIAGPVDRLLGALAVADEKLARSIVSSNPGIIDGLDAEDRQALALAAEEGRADSIRLLLEFGFAMDWEHEWGGTPLHLAAWHGRPDVVKLLLELGAPVNVKDSTYGSSPLAWAAHGSMNCRKGEDEDYCRVIELLLDAGAERPASLNKWNEPPEVLGSRAVQTLLRQRGFVPLE